MLRQTAELKGLATTIVFFLSFLCLMGAIVETANVLTDLASSDAEIRAHAVKRAVSLEPGDANQLIQLMEKKDPDIARAALSALHVLVADAGLPQNHAKKDALAAKLADVLQQDISLDTRRAILRELSLIAGRAQVQAIGTLLRDSSLCEDARAALERIPDEAATSALLEALEYAPRDLQVSILGSLKHKKMYPAPPAVVNLARTASADVFWAALETLAASGMEPFEFVTPEQYRAYGDEEKRRVVLNAVHAAESAMLHGDKEKAERIYLQTLSMANSAHEAAAILDGLLQLQSREGVILALRWIAEPDLKMAAFESLVAAEIPDLDNQLAAVFLREKGYRKAQILRILAQRHFGDLPNLLENATKDSSSEVRLAAAEISGTIPKVEDFRNAFRTGAPIGMDKTTRFALTVAEKYLDQQDRDAAAELAELVVQSQTDIPTLAAAFRIMQQAGAGRTFAFLSGLFGNPYKGPDPTNADPLNRELAHLFETEKTLQLTAELAYVAACANSGESGAAENLESMLDRSSFHEVIMAAGHALKRLNVDLLAVANRLGYITSWKVLGPFPNEDNRNVNTSFIQEQSQEIPAKLEYNGTAYEWQDLQTEGVPAIANFESVFGQQEKCLAYAYTDMEVPEQKKMVILLGSDDGCIVWLNGEKVLDKAAPRNLVVNEDKIPVTLKAGKNVILVKVTQGVGDWELCVRLVEEKESL